MAELLNSETFGDRIYSRFPEVYKRDDKDNDYALKRFIQTGGEGFKCVIDEINGISDLRDSDKTPVEFLPVIFSSHGLDIFNGIPYNYLKNLVPNLNSIFSRKGSISAIEYLCSVVSGIVCEVSTEHFSENNRVDIIIDMDYTTEADFPSIEQLNRIVKEFIPFYCNSSLVFSYTFKDTFSVHFIETVVPNTFNFKNFSDAKILLDDKLEDEVEYSTLKESQSLGNELNENTNFLNSKSLTLSNNMTLNSANGYDTITLNGETTIKTYNF